MTDLEKLIALFTELNIKFTQLSMSNDWFHGTTIFISNVGNVESKFIFDSVGKFCFHEIIT